MKPDNTQETIYVGLDTGLPPYLPYPRFLLKMDISQTAKQDIHCLSHSGDCRNAG